MGVLALLGCDGDVVAGVLGVGVLALLGCDGDVVAGVQAVSARKTSKNIFFFNLVFVSFREVSCFGEPHMALIRGE